MLCLTCISLEKEVEVLWVEKKIHNWKRGQNQFFILENSCSESNPKNVPIYNQTMFKNYFGENLYV